MEAEPKPENQNRQRPLVDAETSMKGARIPRMGWRLRHGLMHELHGGMQARLHYPLWTMLSLTIRRSP